LTTFVAGPREKDQNKYKISQAAIGTSFDTQFGEPDKKSLIAFLFRTGDGTKRNEQIISFNFIATASCNESKINNFPMQLSKSKILTSATKP